MADKRYENREIDAKFKDVHERFDRQDETLKNILEKVTYTNGKVKKIIIAIFMGAGVIIGYMGQDALPTIIKLLI